MTSLWWILLGVSLILITILLFRTRTGSRWVKWFSIQLIVGIVLLYAVNYFGSSYFFYLPINFATLGTVAILGVPGIFLLVAIGLVLV